MSTRATKPDTRPCCWLQAALGRITRTHFSCRCSTSSAPTCAQDSKGQGLVHHLLLRRGLPVLENLFTLPIAPEIDLFMQNELGQTALDLAAIILAEDEGEFGDRRAPGMHALMTAQVDRWNNAVVLRFSRCCVKSEAHRRHRKPMPTPGAIPV